MGPSKSRNTPVDTLVPRPIDGCRTGSGLNLYHDSQVAVPDVLSHRHAAELRSYGEPGTWWTAQERSRIVQEARSARCAAGVQEPNETSDDRWDEGPELPGSAREVVRQLALATLDIDRAFLEDALASGMSDGQYVEIVGIVARIVNLDVFARGIDVPTRELGAVEKGDPSRARPSAAVEEGAWLPSIPCGNRGGAEGRGLYGDDMQPFIYRALSLVPPEARRNMELGDDQYLPLQCFFDFGYSHHPGLTRPQVEVVAARTAAINECFY